MEKIIDGVKYKLVDNEVIVLPSIDYLNSNITILNDVEFDGQSYPVTTISNSVFSEYHSLKSVTIPSSVTSIDVRAFSWCFSLASISVSEKNKKYSSIDGVLYNKEQTKYITIPAKITNITIPKGLTNIGEGEFSWCNSLVSISVSEHNKKYSSFDGVLYNKAQTKYITIPTKITKITIPEGVTKIGSSFYNCSSLKSINIPSTVTIIEENTFSWCYSLVSINVSVQNTIYSSVDGILYNKEKTEHILIPKNITCVTIPDSVTSIESKAFSGCKCLTSITIPEGVTNIGDKAFCWCTSLTNINLPKSITKIGKNVFYGCENIKQIRVDDSFFLNFKEIVPYCLYYVLCNLNESDDLFNEVVNKIKRRKKVLTDFAINNIELIDVMFKHNLIDYELIVSLLKKEDISEESKLILLDISNNVSNEIKEKISNENDRIEDVLLGFSNWAMKDLKMYWRCRKLNGKIVLLEYIGKDEIALIPSNTDGISEYVINLKQEITCTEIVIEEGVTSISSDLVNPIINGSKVVINIPKSVNVIGKCFYNCNLNLYQK